MYIDNIDKFRDPAPNQEIQKIAVNHQIINMENDRKKVSFLSPKNLSKPQNVPSDGKFQISDSWKEFMQYHNLSKWGKF